MPYWWLIQLVVAIVLLVVAYALTPKPKKQQLPATEDLKEPTSEAGRPIPVVFGTIILTSPNVLWWGDKGKREYSVKA